MSFKAVQGKIAKQEESKGMKSAYAKKVAGAIAAEAARKASPAAKKANPNLKNVPGA